MTFGQRRQIEITEQQQLLLYQYRCLNCGTILKETSAPTNITSCLHSLEQVKERCIGCDSLLQKQNIEQVKVSYTLHPKHEQVQGKKYGNIASSAVLPLSRFEIAYDIRPSRLTFDIPKLDSLLINDLAEKGLICVTSSSSNGERGRKRRKKRDDDSNGYYYYYDNNKAANTLVTRLCVRALISERQGGFESPAVIFVDAGNCSDIYQCVNFARQYMLDLDKILDKIIVSRPFTIHQLGSLIIKELEDQIIQSGAKIVIISDILKMFNNQDPQIDIDESKWLIREISRSLRKLSTQAMVVVVVEEDDDAVAETPSGDSTSCRDIRSSGTVHTRDNSLLLLKLFDTSYIHILAKKLLPQSSSKSILLQIEFYKHHNNKNSVSTNTIKSIEIQQRELVIVPAR
jgi:hypothetical protein